MQRNYGGKRQTWQIGLLQIKGLLCAKPADWDSSHFSNTKSSGISLRFSFLIYKVRYWIKTKNYSKSLTFYIPTSNILGFQSFCIFTDTSFCVFWVVAFLRYWCSEETRNRVSSIPVSSRASVRQQEAGRHLSLMTRDQEDNAGPCDQFPGMLQLP